MPLLVFRPRLYENTAENLQFRFLCEELKRRINIADQHNKPEVCLFVGNFNFAEKEFDAFLIKRNGIILIEFKNYGGKIIISNNEWKVEYEGQTGIIKGGSGNKTPLEQARLNRNAFIRNMVDSMTLTDEQAKKIASLVVFNHDSEIENNLRFNIQTWLNICDNKSFYNTIESIVNKDFDFSVKELRRIADQLVLDEDYLIEEYSDMDFFETWNNPTLLNEYSQLLNGEIIFSPEPDPFDENFEEEKEHPDQLNKEIKLGIVRNFEESNIPQIIALYIQQIMSSALPEAPYTVIDCEVCKPQVDFDVDQKYLVRVDITPSDENKNNLSIFIRKPVFSDNESIFWTFGEKIPIIKAYIKEPICSDSCIVRRTHTMLPPWLDSHIFNNLFGLYDPRYKRFEFNDDLNEEEAKIYLGTYFPRSYAESFLIFDNLFYNLKYRKEIECKKKLIALSIGSGSGGDIMGLLVALDKHIPSEIPISVISLDINTNSLELQKSVINRFKSLSSRRVELTQFADRITGKETFEKYATNAFPDKSIDFLLFSKVGCELHAKGLFPESNVYYELLSAFNNKISDSGITSIIDVTTKADGQEYMPLVLNRGVTKFTSTSSEFSTLLPLSCYKHEKHCVNPCFCQQEIFVTHCKKINDVSKICYRIVARTSMCEKILTTRDSKYIITPSKLSEMISDAYCSYSLGNNEEIDAFNLNQ